MALNVASNSTTLFGSLCCCCPCWTMTGCCSLCCSLEKKEKVSCVRAFGLSSSSQPCRGRHCASSLSRSVCAGPTPPSMLVALVGPTCAGKLEVAKYLVVHHNFRPAFLVERAAAIGADGAASGGDGDAALPSSDDIYDAKRWTELVSLVCPNDVQGVQARGQGRAAVAMPDGKPIAFASRHALLDHATFHWRDNIVTLDLTTRADLEIGFDKRPFFLLVGIDAPVYTRWQRECTRRTVVSPPQSQTAPVPSLEAFVCADDEILFGTTQTATTGRSASLPMTPSTSQSTSLLGSMAGTGAVANEKAARLATTHQVVLPSGMLASRPAPSGSGPIGGPMSTSVSPSSSTSSSSPMSGSALRDVLAVSTLVVYNTHTSIAALHTHLAALRLASPHRLRPSWDTYFLSLCTLASLRSNCMKRRVGAVLVRNNRVLSTGYNGTPRGLVNCAEGGCPRCNGAAAGGTALDECLCLHAEENALLECGRERGGADGTVLYCNT